MNIFETGYFRMTLKFGTRIQRIDYPSIKATVIKDEGNRCLVKADNCDIKEYWKKDAFHECANEVREVKRRARVGEWVKIVCCTLSCGIYKNGDILEVSRQYPGFGVYVKTDETLPLSFSLEGESYLSNSEYVVLENYQPPFEECSETQDDLSINDIQYSEQTYTLKQVDEAIQSAIDSFWVSLGGKVGE